MRPVLLGALLLRAASAAAGSASLDVELQRGPRPEGPVRDWFAAQDRILDDFSEAEALASRPAAARAPRGAGRLLELARSMARSYRAMTSDASAAVALASFDLKPPEALSLNQGGLYRWVHLIRQGALDASGPKGIIPVNARLTVRSGAESSAALLDISPESTDLSKAPALRALANALRRMPGRSIGPAILGERRIWLRPNDVEIFADFSPAKAGGAVRVRYRELGAGLGERSRLYFLAQTLYLAGFSVALEGGRLEAQWGQGRLVEEDMLEGWFLALAAADVSDSLAPVLGRYLRYMSAADRRDRLCGLARIFVAEGSLPFLKEGDAAGFSARLDRYMAQEPEREAVRARISRTLAGLGLAEFPASLGVGRRTVQLHYERALEAAEARGEVLSSGGSVRRVAYDPLPRLSLAQPSSEAASLWPLAYRFSPVGIVGRRRALRAQWRLAAGDWLTIYAIEGGRGEFIAALAERGSARARAEEPLSKALARLREGGFLPNWGSSAARTGARAAPADGAVWASEVFGASLDRALKGPVSYDLDRAPKGAVCLTPFLSPSDGPRLKACAAVLLTAAGPLAAAVAESAGIPGMEISGAQWRDDGLRLSLPSFGPPRGEKALRSLTRLRLITLKEGLVIRLDPSSGELSVPEIPPASGSGSLALPAASGSKQ